MPSPDVSDTACRNLKWSSALLAGLIEGGLEHIVLSPGSRSTPLVLAAQRQPRLQLTAVVDERSAAFFALGLARGLGRPVGLVCTSGSASAHWYPAVIEAAEWGVPLVLISADRPPELRAWGANQTIDQTRLFGAFVREFHDPGTPAETPTALKAIRALGRRAVAVCAGRRPGPVHLNLPFHEPLVPQGPCPGPVGVAATADASLPDAARRTITVPTRPLAGRGLICCGPGECSSEFAAALWQCAGATGLPVLTDPLSGLRFGPATDHRIARYDTFLRNAPAAAALQPDWVVRFGRAPVSKTLNAWLTGVPTTVVDPAERWVDPSHDAHDWVQAPPEAACAWLADAGAGAADPAWLALWRTAESAAERAVCAFLEDAPWCEAHALTALLTVIAPQDALFSANSLPIRQLDSWSGQGLRPLRLFGNRGVSGIDGQLSTLAGLNASGLPTWGILGDLALFHDLSGLLRAESLKRPVLIFNNGGGRIFDYLPQAGLPGFEELWRTPVSVRIPELAGCFGLACDQVDGAESLETALATAAASPSGRIIEVLIDGERSRQVHEEFWRYIGRTSIIDQ